MNALYASAVALGLSWGGMAALAFAMDRHYEQLTGCDDVPALQRVTLRTAGGLFLVAVFAPATLAWSASVGVVAALGFWSLGALLAAGLMTWSPRLLAWGSASVALPSLCAVILGLAG